MKGLTGVKRQDSLLTNDDLKAIDNKLYEAKEDELKARTLVSLKTDDPAHVKVISYKKITKKGAAKIFAYGADDVPLVSADIEEHTQRVFGIVDGFVIPYDDLRAARANGVSIDATYAVAARRAAAEKENDFFFVGDSDYNAEGLINFTGIQTFAVDTNDAGSSTEWADKTGPEIIEDIRQGRKKVNIKPGLQADTLGLPPSHYEDLDREYKPGTSNDKTIREVLEAKNWFSRIEPIAELEKAGDADEDSFIVFDSSEDVVQMSLPMDLYRHDPIQKDNLAEQINFEERTGGAVVRFPLGIVRGDGI
ncbi:DUF2184 domain-containing protein [Orenia marismortui]|uniref:DUF2184 domain-containing protein n=1 Tax=Orenia marismortui TaxID=46469 RepID=UPI00035D4FFB|nr:DUF2184 domain-containing protein [Orenia marismortui]